MMNSASDTRITVIFDTPTATDGLLTAILVEGDLPVPPAAFVHRFTLPAPTGHITGCACCTPRGPAATALAALFRARATGAAPYFTRLVVIASPAGQAAIRAALAEDPYATARFCTA
jgi:hypothetical protein